MTPADRARAAHDAAQAYMLQLFENPQPPRQPAPRLPYDLDDPHQCWIVTCNDAGIEIVIDDPASLGIGTAAMQAAQSRRA